MRFAEVTLIIIIPKIIFELQPQNSEKVAKRYPGVHKKSQPEPARRVEITPANRSSAYLAAN
jgi:hypothetical protein